MAALGLGLALLAVCPAGAGAQEPEAPAAEFAPEVIAAAQQRWLPALAAPAAPELLVALAEMRTQPDLARAMLWDTLDPPEEAPPALRPVSAGGWRLIHHLAEFGAVEDIPRLLERLGEVADAREREMRVGVARGLYPAFPEPVALELAVADFVFIQTGQPTPHDPAREGRYVLDEGVFDSYHRSGVPIEAIARLRRLRGRGYATPAAAGEAMQGRLDNRLWTRWGATLLEPLAPLPPRVKIDGLLRLRLINPAQRPLLVRVTYGLWRARFLEAPPAGYAYAPPEGRALHDQPVSLIAPVPPARVVQPGPNPAEPDLPAPVRVDLRLQEVHQPPQAVFRKVALRPER